MKLTKCKICKNEFVKTRPLQPTCTRYECMVDYANQHLSKSVKEKKKQDNKAKREFKQNDKVFLKELAQKVFNTYIRMRDKDLACVSCGTTNDIQYHASHFKPAGGYSYLRFDENNVHKSCSRCNSQLAGNLIPYREALIKKIGIEEVERLEQPNQIKTWTIEEYQEIIKKYRQKTKELKL